MSLVGLSARTKTVNKLRSLLALQGFEEFIPQLISLAQPVEPAIEQFKTGNYYLATSPESYLKKAMAAGSSNCFAISHCFRAMEQENHLHRPDFLMCEYYLKNANYKDVMNFTQELIIKILQVKSNKFPKISIKDLWKKYLDADLHSINLMQFAVKHGFNPQGATWEQLFYQIHINEIEKYYPNEPFFLIDFPAKISPLCKPKDDDPFIAERFELLINKTEIADGNTENFDYQTVKKVMEKECRKKGIPLDTGFISSLKNLRGEKWAGAGLGVDRLAMLIYQINDIKDIVEI